LVGFARPDLGAGEVTEVVIGVDPSSMAERDVDDHRMVVRPGTYLLWAAQHAGEHSDPVEFTLA